MSIYANLQAAARYVATLDAEIESVELSGNFLRNKLADPARYPDRSIEELTRQLLEAQQRLSDTRTAHR